MNQQAPSMGTHSATSVSTNSTDSPPGLWCARKIANTPKESPTARAKQKSATPIDGLPGG
jgi:hypothetical protein